MTNTAQLKKICEIFINENLFLTTTEFYEKLETIKKIVCFEIEIRQKEDEQFIIFVPSENKSLCCKIKKA